MINDTDIQMASHRNNTEAPIATFSLSRTISEIRRFIG